MSSASFDSASSQYLSKINMPPAARSFATWAYRDSATTGTLAYWQQWQALPRPGAETNSIQVIITNTGYVQINKFGLPVTNTANSIGLGEWFHVAAAVDNTNCYVWLNGGSKGSAAHGGALAFWARHALASDYGGGNYFDGKLAHVAMWGGTPLTDAEVLSLYEGRCPPMDVPGETPGTRSLGYYAILDNSYLCDWSFQATGAQLKWTPQNSPTWSPEDPGVYPLIGGMVQL